MKKLIILIIVYLLPLIASADDCGSCGDNVSYTYVKATHTLTISGSGPMVNYNYYSSNYAPWSSLEITKAIIEDGVTSIGDYTFYYCSSLTSVTIPNSVTSIGLSAFRNCIGLTSVTIPNSVTSIGAWAFYQCSGLTSVTIPNSVTSIGSEAFSGCSGLPSVKIPSSVTSIGYGAFKGCSGLTSMTIPNSVTSIDGDVFSGCSGLTSVTIPNSVTSIRYGTFRGCSGLTTVTIPNSVTSIGDGAFSGCSGLTSVNIPNSVTSIGRFTFEGCSSLTSVTIPNKVTSIEQRAFYNCSGLTSVTIPNSVTSIDDEAFSGCTGLTSVTIPNSVTSIGDGAFSGCSGLTSVTIPNSVTSIGKNVFSGCSGLTSVTIPNSVTLIGDGAFFGCSRLNSVVLPNQLSIIRANAFNGCSKLETLTLPASVEYIYQNAFAGCTSLARVNALTTTPPFLYENSFSNYNIPLYVPEEAVETYQATSPWSKFAQFFTLDGTEIEIKKCATPTIAYKDGKISFNCDTEDVQFVYHITNTDVSQGNAAEVNISATYNITVRATRNGYEDSDVATATFSWNGIEPLIDGEVAKYRLSFIVDNNELGSNNVEYGATVTPPTTDNNGNTISWYTYPETMPAHDLVVYGMVPKPEAPTKYTITYKLDGQTYRTVVVEEGASISKEKAPYKEGYTFNGWQDEPTTMPGNDVTVNGTFSVNEYSLSFIVDNVELSAQNVTYGAAFTAPTTDNEGNMITWYSYPSTMPAHDLVVYGMVPKPDAPEKYTITYVLDGEPYRSFVIEEGATVSKEKAPYKEGYTFNGWQDEPTTMPGNDVTVNGTFSVNSYSLSFIVDNVVMSTQNVEYGTTITTPTTDSEDNEVAWYEYPTTMPAHDLVVYGIVVKQEPAKYTLSYVLDGEPYKSIVLEEGAEVVAETAPAKEGYTFSGWQDEPTTMPGRDVTVSGTFVINKYRLSFIAENRELSAQNVEYGSKITAPTTDDQGNTVTWYTYPTTMPAHDLVVYGMVVKEPEPEVFVWLTVNDCQSGYTKIKVKQGAEQTLNIAAEEGWKISNIFMDGRYVTTRLAEDGTFVTPAITSDASIIIVYEETVPSGVRATRSQAVVKVVSDGVIISNAEPDSQCVVYSASGSQVVNTVVGEGTRKITLPQGQVYVLTIDGRTLKFAL